MGGQHQSFHLQKRRTQMNLDELVESRFRIPAVCGSQRGLWILTKSKYNQAMKMYKNDIKSNIPKSYISHPCKLCMKKSGITA